VGVRAGPALSELRAVVLGAAGQDGGYLTELLREQGYEVVGIDRGDVDLLDAAAVARLLRETRPREVYDLASPSFVPGSWASAIETLELGSTAVVALLEAIRAVDDRIRLLVASSAEIFGDPVETPQRETTPFRPRSPYGVAKECATQLVRVYRTQYGLHASAAILFNHESPRRPVEFLPSKVAHGVAAIAAGDAHELVLGDLDAVRDWGYAPDYVRALWSMLQQEQPDDYVIATGEGHTVRELVEIAFAHAGLDWHEHVRVDPSLVRPSNALVGDPAKARRVLRWEPTVTFAELIAILVDAARAQ